MPGKDKQTSKRAAGEAGKLLSTSKSPTVKSVAGSDLSQRPSKSGGKGKGKAK